MPARLHPTIALLQTSSLTSVVQQDLERRIVHGELRPGDKLVEATLADALGVSRGPVREACRMLEEAGLVRQEKNRGVFVRHVALGEALEIFDLRAMLDEAVGRHLAGRITPEQLRHLRGLLDAMERAAKTAHADAYHLLNLEFHDTLVAFTGNHKLLLLYRRLIKELSLFRRVNLADGALLPASAAEHRAIVKAIAGGNAQAAGQAMARHVLGSKERTLRHHRAAAPAPAVATPPAARKKSNHA